MKQDINQYINSINNERKKLFIQKAQEMKCKIELIDKKRGILKISNGTKFFFLYNNQFYINNRSSVNFTRDKNLTKKLISFSKINVAKGFVASNFNQAKNLLKKEDLNYPLIVKPLDASKGIAVTIDIKNLTELKKAILEVKNSVGKKPLVDSGDFLVEEMFIGKDYRVLVLDKKVIACIERVPAHIIGDGKQTIKQLISNFNQSRQEAYHLKIDNEVKNVLKNNNLTLNSILEKEVLLYLRKNANISSGGIAVDHTKEISSRFKKIAIESAKALGIRYTGIDIMTNDITSNKINPYIIVELNSAPDYDIHEKPIVTKGSIDVTKKLINYLLETN